MSKSSSPYDFIILPDKVSFLTKRGIDYACVFILDEETKHLGLNVKAPVYQFVFFPEKPQSESSYKNDARIHLTVVRILQDFFAKNPKGIIMYFCDDSDSKGKARHNLFEKWVHKFNGTVPKKIMLNLSVELSSIHISLLINENHPEIGALHKAMKTQAEELKTAGKPFTSNIQ